MLQPSAFSSSTSPPERSRRDGPSLPPQQRWHIAPAQPQLAAAIATATGLFPSLAQVLINRGFVTPDAAAEFLDPEIQDLPSPLTEFPDLARSLALLEQAIARQEKIAICGDYDADGMTSTALLLRALRAFGAKVDYAIPSRMREGYGINQRMVEEFAAEGVKLILTVDNGIAAHEPIARARELGLTVIITDHHDLPPQLPVAHAILNPKLLAETSPYRGLAGVGVAYVLAVSLARNLNKTQDLVTPLLELFTLGTIADLAPLVGVNRRWVRRGLKVLPHSRFAGVQALIQVSGNGEAQPSSQPMKPEAIGFRLGPRINAVGRIADPQIVIELLTTDDQGVALERAMQCEQANRERQQLCTEIEQAAIAWFEQSQLDLAQERVLVVVQPDWHHGVIGIVASRLLERYGVPVFIGAYETEDPGKIRGSARGIPEFDVFAALQFCSDLLEKFGGHHAAGGFSFPAANLEALRSRLREFAHQQLRPEHLKPLVNIDVQAAFAQLDWELYHQIDQLHPCGIDNSEPIFWTPQVKILEQQRIGRDNNHLKLKLTQGQGEQKRLFPALAWRWGQYYPLPEWVDVAYRLRQKSWNDTHTLELELVGLRAAASPPPPTAAAPPRRVLPPNLFPPPLLPGGNSTPAPILDCPEPPTAQLQPSPIPQWLPLESLDRLLPELEGTILVYGHHRPYLSTTSTPGTLHYDRPTGCHDTLLLWTLPPSWTHLRWLLAIAQPAQIYVRNQIPKLPTAPELRSHLQLHLAKFPQQPLKLLPLGQQWWVAPCTLVAALRELGYPCPDFPATCALEQELQRLERWYLYPAHQLGLLS